MKDINNFKQRLDVNTQFIDVFAGGGSYYNTFGDENSSIKKKTGKTSEEMYKKFDETGVYSAEKSSDSDDWKEVYSSSDDKKSGENTIEVDEDDCGICGKPTTYNDHIQNVPSWVHPDEGRDHAICDKLFKKFVLFNNPKDYTDKMIKIACTKKCHIEIIHSEFIKHLKNKASPLSLFAWMVTQVDMKKIIEKVWKEVEKLPVAK